jgi:site-specific DNA-cytosine methylase
VRVLSLCDGISLGRIALIELNRDCLYHAVEINEKKRKLVSENCFVHRYANDIYEIDQSWIDKWGPYDLVLAGTSCKGVSSQGKRDGGDSFNQLEQAVKIRDMVLKRNPSAKWLFENVKMKGAFLDKYNEIIGRKPQLFDAALVSAQARQRLFWLSHEVERPKDRGITFRDVLGQEWIGLAWSRSSRYIDEATGKVYSEPKEGRKKIIEQRLRTDFKANTLTTGRGCIGQSTANYKIKIEKGKIIQEILSVKECAKLQGLPDWFSFDGFSDDFAYSCIGDSWELETIKHILDRLLSTR